MKTMIAKLTDDEIKFCDKWEQVIKRKWDIKTDDINYCYILIFKQGLTNYCPQCLRDSATHLHNYYKTIMNKYSEYKNEQAIFAEEKVEKVVEKPKVKVVSKTSRKAPIKGTSKKVPKRTSKKNVVTTKKDDNVNTI